MENKKIDYMSILQWCAIVFLIIALIIFFLRCLEAKKDSDWLKSLPTEEVVLTSEKIVALNNTKDYNGFYILGTGREGTTVKYCFYKETNEGIKLETINADEVIIRYDKNPRIETVGYKYIVDNDDFVRLTNVSHDGMSNQTKKIIYCPEGSIDTTFDLDLN